MPLVYGELRKLAASYLKVERGDHTLQPTALVHEAYLRLIGQRSVSWANRAHFYGIAAQMMRRVLVDHARRRLAAKRSPGAIYVELGDEAMAAPDRAPELLALDRALTELERRMSHHNCGEALAKLARPGEAIEEFRRARSAYESVVAYRRRGVGVGDARFSLLGVGRAREEGERERGLRSLCEGRGTFRTDRGGRRAAAEAPRPVRGREGTPRGMREPLSFVAAMMRAGRTPEGKRP